MKNFRGFSLGLVLGLSIAVAGIAYAQGSTTQSDANKKSECCCMKMDGSKADSCPMMKDGAMKDGAMKSGDHGCCCCGDSCDMKDMKHMQEMKMKDMKEKP